MKKLILSFSLALFALTGIATDASADRFDARVDVSRNAADDARFYRGDRNDWHGQDGRAEAELERMNSEVRRVRLSIGDPRHVSQGIRDRFHRAKEKAEFLNSQYRRGNVRGWDARRRAEQIRYELEAIRHNLRGRSIGIGGWR